jgi:hypothetical protein
MGATVYTTARGRRFHAIHWCRALESGQMLSDWDYDYEFPPPSGTRLPQVHAVKRRSSISAAHHGYTACRVCVPPALALPPSGETYGHELIDQYAGTPEGDRGVSNAVCARCSVWEWDPALRLNFGFPVRWPCTSAVVLGLVLRPEKDWGLTA